MAQTNCRIPDELNAAFENAAEERGLFRSEVHRRALRHYVSANPDGFAAFKRYNRVQGEGSEEPSKARGDGRDDPDSGAGIMSVYDPTGER